MYALGGKLKGVALEVVENKLKTTINKNVLVGALLVGMFLFFLYKTGKAKYTATGEI